MAILNSPMQFISSITPAARGFTALLVGLSLSRLLFSLWLPEYDSWFLLYPGFTLWHPWTLVTSSFVEVGIIEMTLSVIILPISLRYVERLWGALETVKFVLVTVGVSNIIAVFINVLEHFVIGLDGYFLFGMSYHGLMALQTGILVALTQAIPEHQILLFGAIGVRVKRLPMLYVTFSNIMCIIGIQSPYILIQFGWLVSWVYLRFYKRTGGDIIGGTVTWGDRSETFAFVHWFPPLLHKPVTILSDVVYKTCTRLKLVKAYPADGEYDGNYVPLSAGGHGSLGGGARAEAERRRAMALKALDQRLASTATASTAAQKAPTRARSTSIVDGSSSAAVPNVGPSVPSTAGSSLAPKSGAASSSGGGEEKKATAGATDEDQR